MDIRIGTSVDVENLIEMLADQLDQSELLEFIKRLDLWIADWDFTDSLIEYCEGEKAKKVTEIKDYSV